MSDVYRKTSHRVDSISTNTEKENGEKMGNSSEIYNQNKFIGISYKMVSDDSLTVFGLGRCEGSHGHAYKASFAKK